MTRYSVQSRDGFLSFPKNMGKNIGEIISKSFVRVVNMAKNF